MNDTPFTNAHRLLHGELAAMWRTAWLRRATARLAPRRRTAGRVAAPLVALIALAASALDVSLDLAATAQAATSVPAPAGHHAAALRDLRERRYAQAYGRFAALADAGDAPSALTALLMVCDGETLFGSQWSATPGQLRRWNALAGGVLQQRIAAFMELGHGDE